MGLDIKQLPPHLAGAIRQADAARGKAKTVTAIAAPKKTPLPASCALAFHCDPPTVTHHSKKIARGKLVDSPELAAAIQMLMTGMRHNRDHDYCVAGPLRCWIQFLFRGPVMVHPFCHGSGQSGTWHIAKPDCDNLAKTLLDVLVAREWVEDDCRIANLEIVKSYGPEPGIAIKLQTLEARHAPHLLAVHPLTGWMRKLEQVAPVEAMEEGVPLSPQQQIEFANLPYEGRAEYLQQVKAARAANKA